MKKIKKLIEVALPLDAINKMSAREKSIRHGHPSTLHLWWARRPLATARAVIFSQMVDDPSALADLFPTEKAQEKERKRLFKIIEDLVQWENTTNEEVLQHARDEILQSWRRTCAENADHPQAKELFDRYKLPVFHDPFAGGGALPIEAQRLGLESHASDLNPIAVIINKAMIEVPFNFSQQSPVNPETLKENTLVTRGWENAQGLAEDVRYYGRWIQDQAKKRIGHLYPKVEITPKMVKERPDLKKYSGRQLLVVSWIWARTVKSPNPAFADVEVPLAATFMLSTKKGKEVYIEPMIEDKEYRFTVKVGKPKDITSAKNGTKIGRGANFKCLMSGTPIDGNYIKNESMNSCINRRLMAIVLEGDRNRVFIAPTSEHEDIAEQAKPQWKPDQEMNRDTKDLVSGRGYGFFTWADLFTTRQLVALTTFSDLVKEACTQIKHDAIIAGQPETHATTYSNSVGIFLGLIVSRSSNSINSLAVWSTSREQSVNLFSRQAIPMAWDFPEVNPFSGAAGDFFVSAKSVAKIIERCRAKIKGKAFQQNAKNVNVMNKIVSTDPPYYNNIAYADLSDFFYIWLRSSLKPVVPDLFTTLAVPKSEELVALPHRHENVEEAEKFFLNGMRQVMNRLAEQTHPSYPVTIYYAFKQSESNRDGTTSTGWETFLEAVIDAGFTITGTWPVRTERPTGVKVNINSLASCIVLVCRQQTGNAPTTRREFVSALKAELPVALSHLQRGNIAPVDLAQAAIGPGMAIYTRYSKVLDAGGKPLSVRQALGLINQILDEVLAEQESDFDEDSRWALAWFEQFGFAEGEFGIANDLSLSKNTSVAGLVTAGIIKSGRGKVRLLRPNELPGDWNPDTDTRLTNWEMVHHLIRVLEASGESAAAKIMAKLGAKAETARELCYRLYTMCERKKRTTEALSYNALVQSWPEITRLAREGGGPQEEQAELF
jgi:putative DNA methylase